MVVKDFLGFFSRKKKKKNTSEITMKGNFKGKGKMKAKDRTNVSFMVKKAIRGRNDLNS